MNQRTILGLAASLAFAGMVSLSVVADPVHADALDDLIVRFYSDVLDRPPDPTGATAWSAFLHNNCTAFGFDTLARSFFGSPEFVQTQSLTLEQLATKFYRAFLNREPDSGGLAAWVDVLRQARLRIALLGFVPSPEFRGLLPDRTNRTAVTDGVTRLYTEILKRSPEPTGLDTWVDYIVATGDLESAAAGFLISDEFEARALTFPEFVTLLYRTFLGRDPESAGLNAWVDVMTQAMLMVINAGFVPSPEFQRLSAAVCPIVTFYTGSGTLSTATHCVGLACLFDPQPCLINNGSGPATAGLSRIGQSVSGSATLVVGFQLKHRFTFDLPSTVFDQAGHLSGSVPVTLVRDSIDPERPLLVWAAYATISGSVSTGGISFQFDGHVVSGPAVSCDFVGSLSATR